MTRIMFAAAAVYAAFTAQMAFADVATWGVASLLIPAVTVLLLSGSSSPIAALAVAAGAGLAGDLIAETPLGTQLIGYVMAVYCHRRLLGEGPRPHVLRLFVGVAAGLSMLEAWTTLSRMIGSGGPAGGATTGLHIVVSAVLGAAIAVVLTVGRRSAGFIIRGWQAEFGFASAHGNYRDLV